MLPCACIVTRAGSGELGRWLLLLHPPHARGSPLGFVDATLMILVYCAVDMETRSSFSVVHAVHTFRSFKPHVERTPARPCIASQSIVSYLAGSRATSCSAVCVPVCTALKWHRRCNDDYDIVTAVFWIEVE